MKFDLDKVYILRIERELLSSVDINRCNPSVRNIIAHFKFFSRE